ncbi:hypothetical protein GALMADRAFT_61996 [Galerina marginata CBS 339.88]|uniref:Nuclear pore complex protein NUP96 C-terminal domain-containing protein n=1 Tax=Galerina marginata (strain CBS 339.88) TaxID=685588 RepID=A0A067TCV0_GALM3|nr:hypothetical protein GALMADRAFT_61996 [Galerina marginata CBS 339.88]
MARFRAYSSDASSSDEEPEGPNDVEVPEKESRQVLSDVEDDQHSESESSSSSSSSEMQEDELISSPPRPHRKSRQDQNALVEDQNGDIHFAHEVNVRVSPASSSSHSPPAKTRLGARGDPTIIPWAQHVGVDAQKMHVMQTSLFRMTEEEAELKAMNDSSKAQKSNNRLDVHSKTQTINRKHSRDSDGDGLRFDSRERASFAHDIGPPIFRPSRKYTRLGITSSIANGNEGAYIDAGLAMGRSFRVGWGPAGQLVHLGSICGPMATTHTSANTSTITISKTLPSLASSPPDASGASSLSSPSTLAAKLLQHHLSHTSISPDESGIPCAFPTTPNSPAPTTSGNRTHAPATSTEPLNFSSFLSIFSSNDTSSSAPIFRLGSALFDPLDLQLGRSKRNGGNSGSSITPDLRNRVSLLRRKTGLSKWLEDVVKPSVDADLRLQSSGSNVTYTAADAAFTHLTGHQISRACTTAAEGGYLKLSTLIGQAGGDELFKEDVVAQLEIWKSEKLSPGSNTAMTSTQNGLVGRGVWRVYNLLGGLIRQEEANAEDVFAGLDWKRIFGLCLWYGAGVDASVADVVNVFERIQNSSSTKNEIARPIPKWAVNRAKRVPSLDSSRLGLFLGSSTSTENTPEDPLYVLIKIHANPALSLSNALNPLSFAPSGLDWGIGLCWHLYIILSRVMRVRDFADRGDPGVRTKARKPRGSLVNDDDDFQPEGHSPSADLLTSSYAFELESWGMVQEAAFVLMHLEGSVGREKALKDLLGRSGSKLDDWITRGLVGSLKLPMTWVDEARAMYELDQGNIYAAYDLYIAAQAYSSAHNLALLELAPDAVMRKDLELLRNLFEPFDSPSRRDKIENWFVRGKVFLDYVEIMTKLPKLLGEVALDNEDRPSVPDATREATIAELTNRAPTIIALLPDILHRSRLSDPRHVAALEEMSKDLLSLVGRSRPRQLSRIQESSTTVFDGATKINLVRGIGYARFLQSIEA